MRNLLLYVSGVVLFLSCVMSCAHEGGSASSLDENYEYGAGSLRIPQRPSDAMTGSEFIEKTRFMSNRDREDAIGREIVKGNIPNFLRQLKPIRVAVRDRFGKTHKGILLVMPDYLAIGSDENFVRIPMTPITAQKIADTFGMMLPTVKLVDAIYAQSDVHMVPAPLPAGKKMTSNEYYSRHNQMIERRLKSSANGKLIAGHKKDIVITRILANRPYRVAIYGWHRGQGRPIQPLSTVHPNTYADYSHGIRLVSHSMTVDGKPVEVASILHDEKLAGIVSNEGTIRNVRLKTSGLYTAADAKPLTRDKTILVADRKKRR